MNWYVTIGFLFLVLPHAHAGRTTAIMPIQMNTVHGGSDAPHYCVSADMQGVAPGGTSRVAYAYHEYKLSLRNLSNFDQNLVIRIEPGTFTTSRNSTNQPAPATPGPTRNVSSALNVPLPLGANQNKIFVLRWSCSASRCWLDGDGGLLAGATDNSAPQNLICLTMQSTMQLTINVTQERGAIIGSLATSAHRHHGFMDKYEQPPPFILINGGRPF